MPLRMITRLWDFCFLLGPQALFCGLLALLELYLPTASGQDAEETLHGYYEAVHDGDPEEFAGCLLDLLRRRGVSEELVQSLRVSLGCQCLRLYVLKTRC